MKVLVCGSTGFVGRAVAAALKARGHRVLGASRSGPLRIDFMAPVGAPAWAERLRELQVDAVVNCVGILMARGAQSFERVHAAGPAELFEGAALAGIVRVVQVSALGADTGESSYLRSKRTADEALLALPLAGTVLRPSLLYGPGCPSTALFATLAAAFCFYGSTGAIFTSSCNCIFPHHRKTMLPIRASCPFATAGAL